MNNEILKNKKIKKAIKVLKSILILVIIFFSLLLAFLFLSNPAIDSIKHPSVEGYNQFFDSSGQILFTAFNNTNKKANWTGLDRIPYKLVRIVIRIEDFRFWSHYGVDFKQLYYAAIANLKSLSYQYGASTITQQLVKNLFFSKTKSLIRKIREVMMALKFENYFSKQEILEWYLNIIEMAKNVYGLEAGSQYYFAKSISQLNFEQQIFLIALITNPIYYSKNYEELLVKIGKMAHKLVRLNEINFKQYHSLLNLKLIDLEIKKHSSKQNKTVLNRVLEKIFKTYKNQNRTYLTSINQNIQNKLLFEVKKMKLLDTNATNVLIVGSENQILAFVPVKAINIYQKFILKRKMRHNIDLINNNTLKIALNKKMTPSLITFSSNLIFYNKK